MANDVNGNPLVLDTAHATLPVLSGKRRVQGFRWTSPSASAAHACTLQDGAGRTLFSSVAAGANHRDESMLAWPITVDGLKLPTLASGLLLVYLAEER